MEEHPGGAELIAEHGEAVGEEGLLHGHEDLAAVGEKGVDALGFDCAVEEERKVGAADGLEAVGRDVGADELGFSEADAGVEDGVFPVGCDVLGIGLLIVGHHHGDLSAEMLFVEVEGLFAVTAKVEIGE